MNFFQRSILGLVVLLFFGVVNAAEEIVVWHGLEGILAEKFSDIVQKFNQKPELVQSGSKIVLVHKGDFEHTLTAGLQVLGSKEAPHILQVYEMGNLVMQSRPRSYVPLDKLTDTPSPLLKSARFVPAISAFYKSRRGIGLPSLPFSATTVLLFYNKDAFRKAGLDPERPPITWEEFEKMASSLKAQGAKNILASGRLSGHFIDQIGAWHNVPVATHGNGVDGEGAKLVVNSPFFNDHLNKLAAWYRVGMFSLEGGPRAEEAFAKGDVLILTLGAHRLPRLEQLVNNKFEIGVGALPFWKKKIASPQNTIAGGTSLWALSGHKAEAYSVIQRFFEYLVSEAVQADWHQATCHMPVILGVEALTEKTKFYEQGLKGKAAKISLESFSGRAPKEFSRGILLPEFPRVREVMVQEMKEAIKGNKTTQEALNQMVLLGNAIMVEGKI